MRHAAMSQDAGFVRPGSVAARALLVALPYVVPEIPPLDLAATAAFFPPVLSPAGLKAVGRETVSIAPDNDRYSTWDQPGGVCRRAGIGSAKTAGQRAGLPLLRLRRVALGAGLAPGPGKPAAAAEPVPNP
jgi:hypothetical protein